MYALLKVSILVHLTCILLLRYSEIELVQTSPG